MFKRIAKLLLEKNQKLRHFAVSKLVRLHNYSHHKIAELASLDEGNIHPKHRLTQYHRFFLDRVSPNDRVLDVGCGAGYLAYAIASVAKQVVGVDISAANIDYATTHHHRDNLKFILADVTTYPWAGHFDKIILSNVLEHIKDRIALLKSLAKLSDTILFRVPMETRDWLTMYKKEKGFEYRLDSTHYIEYSLETIQSELSAAGWTVAESQINWGEFWAVLKRTHEPA